MVETRRTDPRSDLGRMARWAIWAVATAVFIAFVAFVRVPTYLGVAAPSWDKEGYEHVWRIWWRARGEMVDIERTWLFSALLFGSVAVIVVAASLALWLILVRDEPAPPDTPDPSSSSPHP
jgi:hypothetical protein